MGRPKTNPSLVLDETTWTDAFVSWNGATEHTEWRLYAGATPVSLRALLDSSGAHITYTRTGFETHLALPPLSDTPTEGAIRYLAVVAYDREGKPLGGSEIIDREAGRGTGLYVDLDSLWWSQRRSHFGGASFALVSVLVGYCLAG